MKYINLFGEHKMFEPGGGMAVLLRREIKKKKVDGALMTRKSIVRH